MSVVSFFRMPRRRERRPFLCAKCGNRFEGIRVILPPKCPRCDSRDVGEDRLIRH